MIEQATVVELVDDKAIVQIVPGEACGKCCACGGGRNRIRRVMVENTTGAQIEDRVTGLEHLQGVLRRGKGASMTLEVNGRRLKPFHLDSGWKAVRLQTSAKLWRQGRNRVRFHLRHRSVTAKQPQGDLVAVNHWDCAAGAALPAPAFEEDGLVLVLPDGQTFDKSGQAASDQPGEVPPTSRWFATTTLTRFSRTRRLNLMRWRVRLSSSTRKLGRS